MNERVGEAVAKLCKEMVSQGLSKKAQDAVKARVLDIMVAFMEVGE